MKNKIIGCSKIILASIIVVSLSITTGISIGAFLVFDTGPFLILLEPNFYRIIILIIVLISSIEIIKDWKKF